MVFVVFVCVFPFFQMVSFRFSSPQTARGVSLRRCSGGPWRSPAATPGWNKTSRPTDKTDKMLINLFFTLNIIYNRNIYINIIRLVCRYGINEIGIIINDIRWEKEMGF